MVKNMNTYIENLINNIKTTHQLNTKKTLTLEELLYKDQTNKTLLEYMLEYNIPYYYPFIPRLNKNIEAIKLLCQYNQTKQLINLKTKTLITNINNNETLLEYFIQNNLIENIELKNLEYNNKLLNILIQNKQYQLLKNINIKEEDLFNEQLIETLINNKVIDYINFPIINYHSKIIDILKNNNKKELINNITFSENLLINNKILNTLIKEGLTPKISHCTTNIINYLYNLNRPDLILNYFKEPQNINKLFNLINNKLIIDYLLEQSKNNNLDFRYIGLNIDYLTTEQYLNLYLKFSKYNKLDYLPPLIKEEILKKNKSNECLLDKLIKYDKTETIKLIKYYNLDKELDIITYLNLNKIYLEPQNINIENNNNNNFSNTPLEYQTKEIEEQIIYDNLGEENLNLLITLEELLTENDNHELINAIILSYTKEINKGNKQAIEELKKLINIKKQHPDLKVFKSSYSYFNDNDGLHLSTTDINNINHELGHLFHYYLTNDEIPYEFEQILTNIQNNPDILNKISRFSNSLNEYEDKLFKIIEEEYDNWSKEYYTPEKIREINDYLKLNINEKIKIYTKLGYQEEDIKNILNNTLTLEEYLKNDKRIKCQEMLNNIQAVNNSEIQAISDIIDALFSGLYHDSKLIDNNNKQIIGTFGHGLLYYNSINSIFQEIFANYCLLIKSDRKNKILDILKDITGEELITLLNNFYENKIINSSKYTNQNNKIL